MQEDNLSDITLTPRIPSAEENPFIPMAQKMAQPEQLGLNTPEDNPFLAIAKGMGGEGQPPAIGSIASTLSINPDQAAQASKLGGQFGLGQDIALRNMDELRRRSLITRLQQTGMLEKNPALAESLANPAFSAQAHDDIDNLAETGSWIDSISKGFEGGLLMQEMGELRFSPLSGERFYGATPAQQERIEQVRKRMQETQGSGILYMTAQVIAQQLAQAKGIGTAALTGFGIGAATGGAPGAVAGGGVGAATGVVLTTAQMEAGLLYDELEQAGVDPETATTAAVIGGTINGAIELLGAKVAAAPFRPLIRKLIADRVEALAMPTMRSAAKGFAKGYATQVGTETLEETVQEITAMATSEIAKAADGIDSETTWTDALTRITDAAIGGFQGSLLLGGIGPGANAIVDTRRAKQTEAQQKWLDGLQERVAESKVRERNPNAFQEFVEKQVEGKPVATIYVDAEEAKGVLAQLNLTASQVDAIVPGFAEQVRAESERGGDVTIPTALFSARLANTDLGNALRPHMRLSPEALSVTQLEAVRAERERMSAAGQDVIDERMAAEDTAFVESAQRVEETMYGELTAAGQPATEAKINAEFVRNMMASLADRVGVTPEQMFERYPYRVRGEGQAAQAQALEQAVTPAPESGVFDVNNPPTAKPGMRDISQGPAIVALMDYDGTVYYDVNATMHGDLIDTFPEIADTVIDGGFIIDGKYVMNASDGGYAAEEGGSERMAEVRRFTKQVNTRNQLPLAQASSLDADYMALVESGDSGNDNLIRILRDEEDKRGEMLAWVKRNPKTAEKLQGMADEAARLAGLDRKVWRGDDQEITSYPRAKRNEPGIFTTTNRRAAAAYAESSDYGPRQFYVGGKTLNLAVDNRATREWLNTWAQEGGWDFIDRATGEAVTPVEALQLGKLWDWEGDWSGARWKDIQLTAKEQGYDIVLLPDVADDEAIISTVVLDENKIKLADPVTYDEAGNVVPLSRRFNLESPMVFEQAAMATRVPTAVKPLEDALNEVLLADFPTFLRDQKFVAKNLAKFKELNAPIRIDENATEQQQLEQIIEHMTGNLLWLHDAMDPAIRERARMWYVGGRRLVDWMAERHGMSPMGAATVFAVLSPQKNWYENVGLGIRITDIVATQGAATMDAEMQDAYLNSLRKAQTKLEGQLAKHDEAKPKRDKKAITDWEAKRADIAKEAKAAADKVAEAQGNIDSIGNRTLAELLRDRDFFLAAIMVRWFDQTKNDRTYPVISPEGGVGSPMLTDAGTPASIRYGSYNEVAKAIAAYVDGRAENVHYLIGGEHKVRNFYNNLFNPEDPRFATIDTHAIAAAYLMPLAGTDKLVQHGLGGGVGNAMFGMGGGYAVFYEAYRRAAEARGIQPREMQSITWEAIRGMFEAAMKGGLKAPVAATWKRYVDGEIDMDAARANVMQLAGGITTPSWVALPTDMQPSAGYEGVSKDAADAQAQRIATQPTAASVMFEVAPDPIDAELVRQWEALSPLQRQAISVRVAEDIVPRILREYGVAADMVMQVGGWEGSTNVGFALRMPPGPLVRQIAQAVGYALSQQAVFTLSASQFQGSERADIIVLKLQPGTTVEQIGDLYEKKLYPLGIQGHATVQDAMIISLDPGVDGAILANTIAANVAGDGRVLELTYDTGWRSLDDTRITDETVRAQDEGRGAKGDVGRRRIDAYRREATRLVAEYLAQSGQYQQAARGLARGGFDPQKLLTTLNKDADFSTFAHETAHYFLTILGDVAARPDAPASVVDDMNTLLRWFGVKDLATWNAMSLDQQRQYHEQFAYSFETYLFEGKAPSVEMQGLFDQFARWLKQVYQGLITKINDVYKAEFGKDLPILTGEVRQVMDRMLATEDQISRAQAIREMKPQFQTQEQSGMDDATWAAYQELQEQATERAVAELTTATLKEMAWMSRARGRKLRELQRQHDDKRKEIKDEVTEDLRILPVYRAMEFLKRGKVVDVDGTTKPATGQFKLSVAGVQAVMPPGFDVATLGRGRYGMVNEDGLHPDLIAPLYGYANGAELVTALSTAKPFADAVAERTDQRMLSEFSELADPAARSLAVDRAIHNEARARLIAVEQRWAAKLQQPVSVIMEAASQVAGEIIGRQTIRTLSPRAYAAAEARAARLATSAYTEPQSPEQAGQTAATRAYNEAIAAGKTVDEATAESLSAGVAAVEKARERRAEFDKKYGGKSPAEVMMRAKRQQLLQNMLARQALEARAEIDRARPAFKRFFGSDEKIGKTRNMEMVSAARAILGWYGFGKRDKSPAEYVDQLKAYNPAAYAQLEPLILRATRGPQDYRDLTVDEFRVLRDTVDGLWIQARKDKQVKLADRTMALDEVVGELDKRLEEIGVPKVVPGEKRAPTFRDRAARNLMILRSTMRRVESWADSMDGVSTVRPFTNYLVRPVLDAVDKFTASRNKYMKRFRDLVVNLQMPEGTISAPELDYTFGAGNAGIGKAELLGALLHTGNESNYRKLLLGRGWGQEDEFGNLDDTQFKAFVKRMQDEGILTKSDYDFLQAVWDLNEEIKPIAQKAHYELYGFYFTEIPASEVVTPFGTYRGGYVPAATDKFMVADAAQRAGEEELESDWRNSLPSTGRGFTKARMAGYNKALSLDVRVIGAHIDSALRFSMIQPAITQALRILRSREFAARLDRVDPTVKQELLIPWLNRTARQLVSQPGKYKAVDSFWRGVRTRTGMSIMFANLRNALQQFTGLFPAGLKVQPRYLTSALTEYVGSPQRTANSVAALSPFMEDRLKGQSFEMQEQINEVLLNPSKFDKAQAWTDRHGYFLQQAFQNMVDVVTWVGAYNQSLSTADTTVTAEQAQREAIAAGDAAVRLTQGSVRPSDVSAFESGTPFFRTLTQFAGYFNMLANLNSTEYVKVIRDMGFRGNKGKLVYIYMMGFMLPAVVADAIVRTLGGGWEDEDDDGYLDTFMDWFFGSQIRQGVAFVPFGTTAYTLATTAFDDKPYNDRMTTSPSVASLEAATVGVGKAAIAVVDEEKDVTGKNVRDVLTLLSLATGIPFSVLGRPAGYLVDVQRGEVEPTSTYDMIRGTITGTATPESKR